MFARNAGESKDDKSDEAEFSEMTGGGRDEVEKVKDVEEEEEGGGGGGR
jgi:hypothetical protein